MRKGWHRGSTKFFPFDFPNKTTISTPVTFLATALLLVLCQRFPFTYLIPTQFWISGSKISAITAEFLFIFSVPKHHLALSKAVKQLESSFQASLTATNRDPGHSKKLCLRGRGPLVRERWTKRQHRFFGSKQPDCFLSSLSRSTEQTLKKAWIWPH